MSLVFELVKHGYIVEVRAALRRSYIAKVRNALDEVVADLQYRDPYDEPNEQAHGISYSNYRHGDYAEDALFQQIVNHTVYWQNHRR